MRERERSVDHEQFRPSVVSTVEHATANSQLSQIAPDQFVPETNPQLYDLRNVFVPTH